MNPTLHVRIVTPQQLLLDTQALSVSSKNTAGPFDILPQHANFITLVENYPIQIVRVNQKPLIFNFSLAIISTGNNKINIYTNIQEGLENKI